MIELDTSTLRSYVKKASQNMADRDADVRLGFRSRGIFSPTYREDSKRLSGISTAKHKLRKKEKDEFDNR